MFSNKKHRMKKFKIIHLINADTYGGVEVGAKLGQIDCQKYIPLLGFKIKPASPLWRSHCLRPSLRL